MKCGRATHVICNYGAAHNIIITLSKEEIHTNVKNMNARRDNDGRVSNKIEPVERDAVWWSRKVMIVKKIIIYEKNISIGLSV